MNRQLPDEKVKAGLAFAMDAVQRIPTNDREALEAHITGVLAVFMGAMWGTLGTEFARGFIEAQLRSMQPGVEFDRFTKPRVQ
jgi:hypothetical protein